MPQLPHSLHMPSTWTICRCRLPGTEMVTLARLGQTVSADVADEIALEAAAGFVHSLLFGEGTDGGIEIQPSFRAAFRQGRAHDAGGLPDAQSVEIRLRSSDGVAVAACADRPRRARMVSAAWRPSLWR